VIGSLIYTLCALTALTCALLLLRARMRGGSPLLLWSGLCFACLSINNALVVVDLIVFPDVSLFLIRNAVALLGMMLLLYGLIWKAE
jgi:hypothetical protein